MCFHTCLSLLLEDRDNAFFIFVFLELSEIQDRYVISWVLPWWLSGKESTCQCRKHRFDSWVGEIPWRRKRYACLGNAMDRGARWAAVHGVTKSQTQLSTRARSVIYLSSAHRCLCCSHPAAWHTHVTSKVCKCYLQKLLKVGVWV